MASTKKPVWSSVGKSLDGQGISRRDAYCRGPGSHRLGPSERIVGSRHIGRPSAWLSRIGVWSLGQLPQAVKTLSSGGFQHRIGVVTQILDQTTVILDGKLRVIFPEVDAALDGDSLRGSWLGIAIPQSLRSLALDVEAQ